jgi:hypothetical protein
MPPWREHPLVVAVSVHRDLNFPEVALGVPSKDHQSRARSTFPAVLPQLCDRLGDPGRERLMHRCIEIHRSGDDRRGATVAS